ncbi:MAG: zf-HC2 domain-containing protein [Lachnospiraceae bacterium]|nr:zf-HC2 domain-containing protein [Lachnospiraceae bacterium]
MTCFEAQSNIMAFIDKKLPNDKVIEFVRHTKHCPNCSEELEIYYTLVVGMREIDEGKDLSANFKKDLENELDKIDNRVKNVKRAKISTFGIVLATAVVAFFTFYGIVLDKAYNIEQNMLKQRQGSQYFYEHFQEYLYFENRDIVKEATYVEVVEEKNFYEKINSYISTHIQYDSGLEIEE